MTDSEPTDEEIRRVHQRRGLIVMWVGLGFVIAGIATALLGWRISGGLGGSGLLFALSGAQVAHEQRNRGADGGSGEPDR